MSMIDVRNLTFCYDNAFEPVFENVSFRLDSDWRLGFVGRNGRGKTTFLNLLAGKYEYSGSISSSVDFTYFPFEVKQMCRSCEEVLKGICPAAEDWEIMRELSLLNVDCEALCRSFETLSHGERTKLLLAGLFLKENSFLLIDEPTNHLDAGARKAVANYLSKKKSYIIVSHDRAFLDGCVDHILSINRGNIEIEAGNFSSYLENFAKRQAFETAQNKRLEKDIDRLKEAARRTADWADKTEKSKYGKQSSGLKADRGFVGHKAATMMKHAKATEARRERAIEQKSALMKNVEDNFPLKLSPLVCRSERLILLSGVDLFYNDRKVCEKIDLELKRGERVALSGKNGCGKSSLLKLIAGENITHTGSVFTCSGLIISVVPQHADDLSGSLKDFISCRDCDESLMRAVLAKMNFTERDCSTELSSLSEGQKKKVLLAASLSEKAHLYIWDEPLNYIDIYSRIQIENLIKECSPTMLFVEHDISFRTSVATRVVEL